MLDFPEGKALTAFSSEAESLFLLSFPKGICVSLRVALSHTFRKTALEGAEKSVLLKGTTSAVPQAPCFA